MKIGIFSDTHGNLPALKTIVKYFEENKCDEIIHCGDMIVMGPWSKECLDYFFSSNIVLLKGNHDIDYVRGHAVKRTQSHVNTAHNEFIFDLLGDAYKLNIARLPLSVYRNYNGLKVSFMHYALSPEPQFNFVALNPVPTVEFFDDAFAFADVDLCFFGHKHEPCEFIGKKHYVDVGSVGCHKDNSANGIILDVDENGKYKFTRIAVPYNRREVYEELKRRNIPDADFIFDFYFKESENK